MARWQGSENRKPADSCAALKRLVKEEKERRAPEGCSFCAPDGKVTDPKRMVWCHRNQGEKDFTPSHGPRMAGMTRERLVKEMDKCMLVCKSCFGRYLQNAVVPRPAISLMQRAVDLSIWLGPELTAALCERMPESLLLGGTLYIPARNQKAE